MQSRNSVCGRITMVAVAQRLDGRLDDEIRRSEIGLANAEIDYVAALRGQRIGASEHGKSIFLADAIEGRDCTKHNCTPPARTPLTRHMRGGASSEAGSSADQTTKIKRCQRLRSDAARSRIAAETSAHIAPKLEADIRVWVVTKVHSAEIERAGGKQVGTGVEDPCAPLRTLTQPSCACATARRRPTTPARKSQPMWQPAISMEAMTWRFSMTLR